MRRDPTAPLPQEHKARCSSTGILQPEEPVWSKIPLSHSMDRAQVWRSHPQTKRGAPAPPGWGLMFHNLRVFWLNPSANPFTLHPNLQHPQLPPPLPGEPPEPKNERKVAGKFPVTCRGMQSWRTALDGSLDRPLPAGAATSRHKGRER